MQAATVQMASVQVTWARQSQTGKLTARGLRCFGAACAMALNGRGVRAGDDGQGAMGALHREKPPECRRPAGALAFIFSIVQTLVTSALAGAAGAPMV